MAKSVVIILNPVEFWEWDVFATASRVALDRCKYWQTVLGPNRVLWIDGIRAKYISNGRCSTLLYALSYGRSALATLDVDKIYAVLGLSLETFRVDYKESVIDTYLQLAAHIVAR